MSLEYNGANIVLAKNLRKNATPQEKHLWYDFLSGYEVRFQRQKPIGEYIADFYCHKARLVIELDGSQHYHESIEKKDELRTEYLKSCGLTVLRFTNRQIDDTFREVCEHIDMIVKSSIKTCGKRSGKTLPLSPSVTAPSGREPEEYTAFLSEKGGTAQP